MSVHCRPVLEALEFVVAFEDFSEVCQVNPFTFREMTFESSVCALRSNHRGDLDSSSHYEGIISSLQICIDYVQREVEEQWVNACTAELVCFEEAGVHQSEVLHAIMHGSKSCCLCGVCSEALREGLVS